MIFIVFGVILISSLIPSGGYPLVSRNGMLVVCKKKFAIRYPASITRAR